MNELAERWEELPIDKPLVVHCKSGAQQNVYWDSKKTRFSQNLINLKGGILAAELHIFE